MLEMFAQAPSATQEVVEQDKGRTPQGSNGSPQAPEHQEAASAVAVSATPLQTAVPEAPSEPVATGGRPYQGLPECPASPSPTPSDEMKAFQAHSRARGAAAAEAAVGAGFRPHDKAAESPDGHVVALKACASETAAREPILSPTRVLLKG